MGSAPTSTLGQVGGLIGWLVLTFVAAGAGAAATANAQAFYKELVRPSWAPPSRVFGPVWSVLYALMGVSAWWVWQAQGFAGARAALILFVVQLAVNVLWSWLFFAWRRGGLAFADVLLLWLSIGATVVSFLQYSGGAAALLLPYWAWVTFAAALNFAVWRRNPQLL